MTRPRQKVITEIGEEIQCARCKELWPNDAEFYYDDRGRPHSWCIACYCAAQVERRERRNDKQRQGITA